MTIVNSNTKLLRAINMWYPGTLSTIQTRAPPFKTSCLIFYTINPFWKEVFSKKKRICSPQQLVLKEYIQINNGGQTFDKAGSPSRVSTDFTIDFTQTDLQINLYETPEWESKDYLNFLFCQFQQKKQTFWLRTHFVWHKSKSSENAKQTGAEMTFILSHIWPS